MTILDRKIGAFIVVLLDVLVEIEFRAHFVGAGTYRNKIKKCHNFVSEVDEL